MDEILLTMGMIAYNEDKYIEKSLDSLLAQTYKNFILIISDDGSTDRTQQICEDCVKKDKRIIYIRHNERKGSI
ncbi:MAG: glycosyltransferase family 2 protein, partial [Nanoarchaeota archaeon]